VRKQKESTKNYRKEQQKISKRRKRKKASLKKMEEN